MEADQTVRSVGNACQNHQSNIGLDGRFHRRPHAMDKNHVKDRHIAQSMLQPELVITEPGGAGIGDHRRGDQSKNRTGEQPEIGNVKQCLGFSHQHIAAEDHRPAADSNGKMIHRVRSQGRNGH